MGDFKLKITSKALSIVLPRLAKLNEIGVNPRLILLLTTLIERVILTPPAEAVTCCTVLPITQANGFNVAGVNVALHGDLSKVTDAIELTFVTLSTQQGSVKLISLQESGGGGGGGSMGTCPSDILGDCPYPTLKNRMITANVTNFFIYLFCLVIKRHAI
jgi:hypothetical protein